LLHRPWIIAAVTLAVLTVVNYAHEILSSFSAYLDLHRTYPFYFAESVDKIAGVILCCLAVWLMRRTGLRGICRELGLSNITVTATAFGVGVSLPMLLGFAISRGLTPHIDPLALLFLTVFSPIVLNLGRGVPSVRRTFRRSHRVMPGLMASIFSETCFNQASWFCAQGAGFADCVGRNEAEPPITMMESNKRTKSR
jgi:hypothetical protein